MSSEDVTVIKVGDNSHERTAVEILIDISNGTPVEETEVYESLEQQAMAMPCSVQKLAHMAISASASTSTAKDANSAAITLNAMASSLDETEAFLDAVKFTDTTSYDSVGTGIIVGRDMGGNRKEPRLGRNEPCHCGSGVKFKRCCLGDS